MPEIAKHQKRWDKVIIRGVVLPWNAKEPYVVSGHSLLGAVEYDSRADEVRCHQCGNGVRDIARHAVHCNGGLNSSDYRHEHGISKASLLSIPSVRLLRVKHARAFLRPTTTGRLGKYNPELHPGGVRHETRNLRGRCDVQLEERFKRIAAEMPSVRSRPWTLIQQGFLPSELERLRDMALITPGKTPPRWWRNCSRESLVELIRDAKAELRRVPTIGDCHPPLLPTRGTFKAYFGSFEAALDAAGLGLVATTNEANPNSTGDD